MKTNVHLNSREAFHDSVVPRLGEKQASVLKAIKDLGQATDKQIASELGWPINSITNRRGELADRGLIWKIADVVNENGRRVSLWAPKPKDLGPDPLFEVAPNQAVARLADHMRRQPAMFEVAPKPDERRNWIGA